MNTNRQTSFVKRILHTMWLAVMALSGTSGIANAETTSPFEIVPAIAGPGISRQISVTVPAAVGCLPTARVVSSLDTARKRTLTISFDVQVAGSPPLICTGLLVRHKATISYTPQEEGDLRILAVGNFGQFYGETALRTRAENSNRSQYDLTGMWYDPATNGSGVTFVHGATKNDQVFGTWYVYDSQGIPRWYTIQNVVWRENGMEAQGQLYETRANSIVCVPPYTGCPVALAFANTSGFVSITMQGPNAARITAVSSNGGTTLTSNLIRSIF
jgi:hypothetical protein